MKFILNMFKYFLKKIYILYLNKGKNLNISLASNISVDTIFEGMNKVGDKTNIGKSKVGFGTYIGENCSFSNVNIGRYCSIGRNVRVLLGTHPTTKIVSTHPAFFSLLKQSGFTYVNIQKFKENKYYNELKKTAVKIGNDVWIADNVLLVSGIKIADGCIIAAGAVVTKNTEPYTIYGGIPAQKIKTRFEKREIEFLLNFKWWKKDQKWIEKNSFLFEDIKKFMEKIENENSNSSSNI